jgi:ABC-type multidrug transport system ATPase subunit
MPPFSIKLESNYKSLAPFFWDNIPNLCVITGTSGTGKSHLLEMIARGCRATGDDWGRSGQDAVVDIQGIQTGSGKVLYVPADRATDFSEKVTLTEIEKRIQELYDLPLTIGKRGASWRSVRPLYDGFYVPETNDKPDRNAVQRPTLAEFRLRLTAAVVAQGSLGGRNPNLAMLFFAHSLLHANLMSSGKPSAEADTLLNVPPWKRLDQIFETAGLHLRCQSPPVPSPSVFHEEREFILKFLDSRTGQLVTPNSLSSGEKALCALLFLEYSTSLEASRYGLILLDEPDAHLHPDFVKRFFRVIETISATNCRIALTTHSPTTVALAPEDSLFIMRAPGAGAPEPTSRSDALVSLLSGVPSLSVIAENNRQVFVESQYDAQIYAELYGILRTLSEPNQVAAIKPDISLSFVSSGNGGTGSCDQVAKIVSSLKDNPFVSGMIDWDRGAAGSERIVVLGSGERYSIENFIFDPVVLAGFLLQERYLANVAGVKFVHKLADGDNRMLETAANEISQTLIATLNTLLSKSNGASPEERNKMTECLKECAAVLKKSGNTFSDDGAKVDVTYRSGVKVRLPKWLLLIRGHNLEDLALLTFPQMAAHTRRPNNLKMQIIQKVLAPHPGLIPLGIATALAALQTTAGHNS